MMTTMDVCAQARATLAAAQAAVEQAETARARVEATRARAQAAAGRAVLARRQMQDLVSEGIYTANDGPVAEAQAAADAARERWAASERVAGAAHETLRQARNALLLAEEEVEVQRRLEALGPCPVVNDYLWAESQLHAAQAERATPPMGIPVDESRLLRARREHVRARSALQAAPAPDTE